VRALGRADTPPRRRELAHGLGYWASAFVRLPGEPGVDPRPGLDPLRALDQIPDTSVAAKHVGLIYERALLVRNEPDFEALMPRVEFGDALPVYVTRIAQASAALYLARPGNGFSYLHGATSASALRLLAPLMSEATRHDAMRYHWQALAAVHASGSSGRAPLDPAPADPVTLPAQAAQSLDDHTIKLAEVMLRERDIEDHDVWMRAAAAELLRTR
jgi:hypothetical protein